MNIFENYTKHITENSEHIELKVFISENERIELKKSNPLEFFDERYTFYSFENANNSECAKSKTKPSKYYLTVKDAIKETSDPIQYSILYKKGDDLRRDFFVIQSLRLMKEVWNLFFLSRFLLEHFFV